MAIDILQGKSSTIVTPSPTEVLTVIRIENRTAISTLSADHSPRHQTWQLACGQFEHHQDYWFVLSFHIMVLY